MEEVKELLSNCCGAPMLGEPDNTDTEETFGRCADCKEMAVFEEAA